MNADERRLKRGSLSSAFIRVHLRFLLFSVVLAGCASEKHQPTTRPSTIKERQEAALRDPFGYSPDMDGSQNDISGGEINEFDRKAMRKDIDHVLNP
jgi:hypothetical protein